MIQRTVLFLVLQSCATCFCLAQPNQTPDGAKQSPENPSWLPRIFARIDLSTLSYARMGTDQKSIQFVKPGVRTETSTKQVEMCTMTTETRQRTAIVDGKEVVQDYAIQVPVINTVDVPYTIQVSAGVQKFELSLDKLRAWELSGKELNGAELSKRLSKPTQVLVERISFQRLANFQFQPIEPFFGGVIKLDTIVIYCPHEESKSADTPKPPKP